MCDRHKVGHGLDLVCRLALDLRENLSKFENKVVSSPQILLQLVAAFEAVRPLVTQPGEKSLFESMLFNDRESKRNERGPASGRTTSREKSGKQIW